MCFIKVRKLIIGKRGILSTPAVSNLIRKYKVLGGIVLTASHNPGGINNDFGIKYNTENGGPAPDAFTNAIFEQTKTLAEYKTCVDLDCDFQEIGEQSFKVDNREFTVDVIDAAEDYVVLMKEIFDFDKLRALIKGQDGKGFNVLIDSMNGGEFYLFFCGF